MRSTPWHTVSWNRFIDTSLPELLASRLSVVRYDRKRSATSVSLTVGVTGSEGREIVTSFDSIPMPDSDGVFLFGDEEVVVVPTASDETLDQVECCGEQALSYVDERISKTPAPEEYFTDEESLRAWIPLALLVEAFLLEYGQIVDNRNAVARSTHLNRILVPGGAPITSAKQIGRACPIETPTGPNIGRVLTIAPCRCALLISNVASPDGSPLAVA